MNCILHYDPVYIYVHAYLYTNRQTAKNCLSTTYIVFSFLLRKVQKLRVAKIWFSISVPQLLIALTKQHNLSGFKQKIFIL